MKYRFARSEKGAWITYEFQSETELDKWIESELSEYKKINCVTNEEKDRSYQRFKKELIELYERRT